MAESKSSIVKSSGTSNPAVAMWTTLASGENNTYIDVNAVDTSKLIILVANNKSTGITATCGMFLVGASDSSATGSSLSYPYSAARLYRMAIDSTRSADTDAAFPSTGGKAQVSILGPFETARFKSSDGYIKLSKRKSAGDAGDYYVCPILIP